jgi:hypothetical protein
MISKFLVPKLRTSWTAMPRPDGPAPIIRTSVSIDIALGRPWDWEDVRIWSNSRKEQVKFINMAFVVIYKVLLWPRLGLSIPKWKWSREISLFTVNWNAGYLISYLGHNISV